MAIAMMDHRSNIIGKQEKLSREVVESQARIFVIVKEEMDPEEAAFLDRFISAYKAFCYGEGEISGME